MYPSFPGGSAGEEPVCNAGAAGTVSSIPGWGKIPWRRARQPTPVLLPGELSWTEEPGRLQTLGSQRVGHKWSDLAHRHTFMYPAIICPPIHPSIHTSILYIIYVSMSHPSRYLHTVYLSINLPIYTYLSIHVCIYQCIIYVSINHLSIRLSTYLFIFLIYHITETVNF